MKRLLHLVNVTEEWLLAILLAAMTCVTFSQVIARYVFNSGAVWALELTTFLFAWLVLLGASYCVRETAHLGVDVVINLMKPRARRFMAMLVLALCGLYTLLLLKGAFDYWSKFYQIGLEVEDIPFPHWLQDIFGLYEDGEYFYDRLPRYIPYVILPVGLLLLLVRFVEVLRRVWHGETDKVIAGHEMGNPHEPGSPASTKGPSG